MRMGGFPGFVRVMGDSTAVLEHRDGRGLPSAGLLRRTVGPTLGERQQKTARGFVGCLRATRGEHAIIELTLVLAAAPARFYRMMRAAQLRLPD
jgi:hypothetical protein